MRLIQGMTLSVVLFVVLAVLAFIRLLPVLILVGAAIVLLHFGGWL